MPVKNRDDERLYKKSTLGLWFAVSSVVLVLCVGLMLWKDWARPWKRYQRQFREKQVAVADTRLKEVEAQQDPAAVQAATKAVEDVQKQIEKEHGARLREIADRRAQLAREVRNIDGRVKNARGRLTEARYDVEVAEANLRAGHGSKEAVEKAIEAAERHGSDLDTAEIEMSNVQSEDTALAAEAEALRKPIADAEAALAKLRAEADRARQTAEGLRQRYARNPWRNAPIVDFISPTLKIDQVVVANIHDDYILATNKKVDRCTTCHMGSDIPDFGDPAMIKQHDIPGWMQAHPGLGLMVGSTSPHAKDKVGCTVCHAGVGWSTDFARAAHHPPTPEEKARWQEEHGWKPPEFVDYPMLPLEYTEGQCFKCHKEGMYFEPHYVERLDHGFAFGRDKDGSIVHLQKTPDGRPVGYLEAFGEFTLPPAPPPTDGDRQLVTERTRQFLAGEMTRDVPGAEPMKVLPGLFKRYDKLQPAYEVHDYGRRAEAYDRGYDSVTAYGCQGCHKIEEFGEQVGYAEVPKVAPDLRFLADKVTPRWLERWIRAPETYRIDTPMPSFFYFVPKDRNWVGQREGGRLRTVPVMDAHLVDPGMAEKLPVGNATPRDLARLDVEILAMKTALLAMSSSRSDPAHPAYEAHPLYAAEPPAGDPARGRKTVGTYGCAACHVVPEVEVNGAWVPDDGARFGGEMLIGEGSLRGPRLTSLGSKLKDRKWLDAWLENPRHYTADTRMGDMRFKDEVDAAGQVVRTKAQVRADVVDYLLSFKDAEFEAIPDTTLSTQVHFDVLAEEYEEFFGKGAGGSLIRKRDIEGRLAGMKDPVQLGGILRDVGDRLLAQHGCFGCHLVRGHETGQPIGTELTRHGVKDLHQLDFGKLAHGTAHDVVPHKRWEFFRKKITYPRIWEVGKVVQWNDRLRMPRFNFRMDDDQPLSTRAAVTGMVLGLVAEPIQPGALFQPDEVQRDIVAGRRVIKRYGCNNCHTIEGKEGILVGWITDAAMGASRVEAAFAPPNLFAEGVRAQGSWLMRFLTQPFDLRPQAVPHMPRFGFKPAEAAALVAYFQRVAGDVVGLQYQPETTLSTTPYPEPLTFRVKEADGTEREVVARDQVSEARALFDAIGCNKCHLPRGAPGADPTDGGVAPSFEHSRTRLQRDWVRTLLNDPQHLIEGTKMTAFWPGRRGRYGRTVQDAFRPFLLDLRHDPEFLAQWNSSDKAQKEAAEARLALRQMDWIADYVVHHYRPPAPPAEAPR
jgi:cytochrome c2